MLLLSSIVFFFFKQKTAYEIMPSLVGSEMCIRDRASSGPPTSAGRKLNAYTSPVSRAEPVRPNTSTASATRASWSPSSESTSASQSTRNSPTAHTAPKVAGRAGVGAAPTPTPARPATFGAVCAVGEFRVLWLADVLSLLGDQLARVALAVLVFGRTGSALLTGLVYALSFLPALVGGPLLVGLADRLPRRRLMVSCDLARGLVVAVMTAPGAPLWLLCALLVGAVLLTAPFTAARAALLPDVLPDDRYVLASAINNITDQGAQVLGFAVGGGLAALLGSSMTLGIDAATFVASALLLQLGLAHRPAPSDPKEGRGRPSALRSALAGSR